MRRHKKSRQRRRQAGKHEQVDPPVRSRRGLSPTSKKPRAGQRSSLLLIVWRLVVVISVVATIVAAGFSLRPSIGLRAPSSTATDDPTVAIFIVSNDGWLPLRNVAIEPSVFWTYRTIDVDDHRTEIRFAFKVQPQRAQSLASGQRLSFQLPKETNLGAVRKVAVEIIEKFDAWWLPYHHEARARFIADESFPGKFDWMECTSANCSDKDFLPPKPSGRVDLQPTGDPDDKTGDVIFDFRNTKWPEKAAKTPPSP